MRASKSCSWRAVTEPDSGIASKEKGWSDCRSPSMSPIRSKESGCSDRRESMRSRCWRKVSSGPKYWW